MSETIVLDRSREFVAERDHLAGISCFWPSHGAARYRKFLVLCIENRLTGVLAMLGLGIIGAAGHYLVIRAFRDGPAAVIAPLSYVELIGTATLGYLIFDIS